MTGRIQCAGLFGVLGAVALACCSITFAQRPQSQPAPLVITTDSLPEATAHQEYKARLQATGGVPPLRWEISAGKLPNGLEFSRETGVITGIPAEAGDFQITVTVTDSSQPPHSASKDFRLISVGALSVDWKAYPHVDNDQISGSLTVANGTKDPFDVTVIVVVVNEYGKAFALGYQRFELKPDGKDVEIKFGSSVPRGQYLVHADAIAEVPAKKAIYRNRLETPQVLVVTAPSL